MKHYLFLIFVLLFITTTACVKNINSEDKYLTVEYNIVDRGVFVTIYLDTIADSIAIKFPKVTPGTYSKLHNFFNINNVTIDKNITKFYVDTLERCINIYSISNNKIKYFVETNDFTSHNILNDGIFISPELVVLNNNILLGIITGYEKYKIKLKIIKDESYKNISSLNYIVSNAQTDYYTFGSFRELFDNPIIYSTEDKRFQIKSNEINFNFGIYAPLNKISSKTLYSILKPTIDAIAKEIKFCYHKNYYNLTFIFNSNVSKDIYNMSALEHKNSSIYCFYSEPNIQDIRDSIKFAHNIQKIVSHECTHLFTPLNFSDSLTANFNYLSNISTPNLLIYEGFTEYQSLKLLLNNRIITSSEFLHEMEVKITRFEKYMKMGYLFNLNELSRNIYKKPNWLNIYYSRGCILSFLLDINIIKNTNGKENLFSILKEIYKESNHFNGLQIYYYIEKKYPELKEFIEMYILGNKYPDLKTELLKCGLLYSKIFPDDFFSYPLKIVNDYNTQPMLYCYKENYTIPKDTFILKEINNTNQFSSFDLNELLKNNPEKETIITVMLEKYGKIETYKITPIKTRTPKIPFYPNISISKKINSIQSNVYNKLFEIK